MQGQSNSVARRQPLPQEPGGRPPICKPYLREFLARVSDEINYLDSQDESEDFNTYNVQAIANALVEICCRLTEQYGLYDCFKLIYPEPIKPPSA